MYFLSSRNIQFIRGKQSNKYYGMKSAMTEYVPCFMIEFMQGLTLLWKHREVFQKILPKRIFLHSKK